jgi:uncharacterized protein YxjI
MEILELNTFLIREHAGLLKFADTYDIIDPSSGKRLGLARERPSFMIKFLRLLAGKRWLPTTVYVFAGEEESLLFSIHRGFTFFRTKVWVQDKTGKAIGYFKSEVFWKGFFVYDLEDNLVAKIKGDWVGWDFKFLSSDGKEIGSVTKKFSGIGKEFFTSADNYVINIAEEMHKKPTAKILLFAAALAIDIVYHEKG